MRRHRRLVMMDRLIPFLAAFVGLVALAGAVLVQHNASVRTQLVLEEMAQLRGELDALAQRTEALAVAPAPVNNDGTIEAMLALQDRMNELEAAWDERPVTTATAPGLAPFSASPDGTPGEVDPSWPTDNCIPIGTRFMASAGEEMAICESPVVVRVTAVSGENVLVEGAGVINETASRAIPGSNCSLMVFDADPEGFAEMRVSCN